MKSLCAFIPLIKSNDVLRSMIYLDAYTKLYKYDHVKLKFYGILNVPSSLNFKFKLI